MVGILSIDPYLTKSLCFSSYWNLAASIYIGNPSSIEDTIDIGLAKVVEVLEVGKEYIGISEVEGVKDLDGIETEVYLSFCKESTIGIDGCTGTEVGLESTDFCIGGETVDGLETKVFCFFFRLITLYASLFPIALTASPTSLAVPLIVIVLKPEALAVAAILSLASEKLWTCFNPALVLSIIWPA